MTWVKKARGMRLVSHRPSNTPEVAFCEGTALSWCDLLSLPKSVCWAGVQCQSSTPQDCSDSREMDVSSLPASAAARLPDNWPVHGEECMLLLSMEAACYLSVCPLRRFPFPIRFVSVRLSPPCCGRSRAFWTCAQASARGPTLLMLWHVTHASIHHPESTLADAGLLIDLVH